MPLYQYVCRSCGHCDDEFQKMSSDPLHVCPNCNEPTYCKQVSLVHTDLKEFHTPIEMFSIAVNSVEEARELKRKCPDLDISDDPADPNFGVPIARSRKAKLQGLKASGFIERS